jgi:hypothetical protein
MLDATDWTLAVGWGAMLAVLVGCLIGAYFLSD